MYSNIRILCVRCWGRSGNIVTQEIDKKLASKGVEGGNIFDKSGLIIDRVAMIVLGYYAFYGGKRCTDSARDWYEFFATVGLRQLIQNTCGWNPTKARRLTPEEIIELCVLPAPTEWQRRFPVEYYSQLERLTGLKAKGNTRPPYWARLTKELVYDYLPEGIYKAIKRCKAETINKAKALTMAVWQGKNICTTAQLAEFYEVRVETIQQTVKRNKAEFVEDGLKVLRSKALREAMYAMSVAFESTKNITQLTVWTPRAAMRLGFLLRDSEIAKHLRTIALDAVEIAPKIFPYLTRRKVFLVGKGGSGSGSGVEVAWLNAVCSGVV